MMILCRHVWRTLVYVGAPRKGQTRDHIVNTVTVSKHLNKSTALRDRKMFPEISTALAHLLGITKYD